MPMSFTAKEHFDETLELARGCVDPTRFRELVSYCEGMIAATRIGSPDTFSQQEADLYRSRVRSLKYRRQLDSSRCIEQGLQHFLQINQRIWGKP